MSNRLVKEFPGGRIVPPVASEPIISIQVFNDGKMVVHAPNIHPRDLCKMLSNLQFDLLYGSFQMAEKSSILTPGT